MYFFLSKAMNALPVGFTYATYGGLTITAVLFGVFKYNQIPNLYGTIGIILIIIGVILLKDYLRILKLLKKLVSKFLIIFYEYFYLMNKEYFQLLLHYCYSKL
jgi:amino acid permease